MEVPWQINSLQKLIAIALWTTALGGAVYITFPGYTVLKILYGYWGFTTIFLFWASMIKATRVWGGTNSQGKAFGFLAAGRGLVGALFATMGVFIFSIFMSSEISEMTIIDSRKAFRYVILVSMAIVFLVGLLVWFFMKTNHNTEKNIILEKISFTQVLQVLKLPSVWLLMLIILCAYVGYKITDIFSLYAQDVMLYNQVQAAEVGTLLLFMRPVVGVVIGILADRSQTTYWLFLSFVISFFGALLLAIGVVTSTSTILFFISILIVATGVYATRSLYFSVMERGRIPIILTGTAVGLISLIGYTPDIFAGPMIGYFLDSSPGTKGHQQVFWILALFSFIGALAAWWYFQLYRTKKES